MVSMSRRTRALRPVSPARGSLLRRIPALLTATVLAGACVVPVDAATVPLATVDAAAVPVAAVPVAAVGPAAATMSDGARVAHAAASARPMAARLDRSAPAIVGARPLGGPRPAPAADGGADRVADASTSGSETFTAPVPIVVLVPFEPPETRYSAGHRGVDLAAAVGGTVVAAGNGVVAFAGRVAGRGVVSVDHAGGLRTTYESVEASVRAGDAVARGAVIGTVEGTGHAACAPAVCLHFGARMPDRVYLDPLALLRPWRVRLKPWGDPM